VGRDEAGEEVIGFVIGYIAGFATCMVSMWKYWDHYYHCRINPKQGKELDDQQ